MDTPALVVYLQQRQLQLAHDYFFAAKTEVGREAIRAVDQELQRHIDDLSRLPKVA